MIKISRSVILGLAFIVLTLEATAQYNSFVPDPTTLGGSTTGSTSTATTTGGTGGTGGDDVLTPPDTLQPAHFSARTITKFGKADLASNEDMPNYLNDWTFTTTNQWTPIANKRTINENSAATRFLTTAPSAKVVVDFAAVAMVNDLGKAARLRLLIDGTPMNPGEIILTEGNPFGARSFSFHTEVGPGIHIVQAQWRVESGARAMIKDVSLLVRQNGTSHMEAVTPSAVAPISTSSKNWSDVPGMNGIVEAMNGTQIMTTFSAEAMTGNGPAYVRVLVDGQVAAPGAVLFAQGDVTMARAFTFIADSNWQGNHNVQVQWKSPLAKQIIFMSRSLVMEAARPGDAIGRLAVDAKDFVFTSSQNWKIIPGMTMAGFMPDRSELAVDFSASIFTEKNDVVHVGLMVNGQVLEDQIIRMQYGEENGVQRFVFQAKHFNVAGGPVGNNADVAMVWRADPQSEILVTDRTMTLWAKHGDVPDLSRAPKYGYGNRNIEPAQVQVPVLTLMWDPKREEFPAPSTQEISDALFGPDGVNQYFNEMSNGRFGIYDAGGNTDGSGIFRIDAQKPADHYWGGDDFLPYITGQSESIAEAFEALPQGYLTNFDRNGDGVIVPKELAVVMLVPEDSNFGHAFEVKLYDDGNGKRSDEFFEVDGLVVQMMVRVYTNTPQKKRYVIAHELSHLVLGLGDMSWNGDAYMEAYQNTNNATQSGSLMGYADPDAPELDANHRVALGWLTPWNITSDGFYKLKPMTPGLETYVLPRTDGGDGLEYYILEFRQNDLSGAGVLVWHVVEGPDKTIAPECVSADGPRWLGWMENDNDNLRQGIRTLKPYVDNSVMLWDSSKYVLGQEAMYCPTDGPLDHRIELQWADKTQSGYSIDFLNIADHFIDGMWTFIDVP